MYHHECLLTAFSLFFSSAHIYLRFLYVTNRLYVVYNYMYVKISRLHKFTNILFDEHARSIDDTELHKNQIQFV